MISLADRLVLAAYVVSVSLAGVELWLLRRAKSPHTARERRQACGWILMMTVLPVAVFQDNLTTAEVLVLIGIAVGPGIALYLSNLRSHFRDSSAG